MSDTGNLIGVVLDERYRVDRVVGKGGMGTVYEGENVKIGKRVAIKVLHAELIRSDEYVRRFQREARAAAEIGHAHIIEVFDSGTAPGDVPYIVMEYLDGEGLDQLIEREESLPPNRAVDIAGQVLHALADAHNAGIIHRDLKPENIFLCEKHDMYWQGETSSRKRDFVKILDFGISMFRRQNTDEVPITQTGVIFGTPYYMSPEQARASKDIDFRSDIYAVGALLYTMLSGIRPFDGDNAIEILSKVIHGDYKSLGRVVPDLPKGLVSAIEQAMAPNPFKRYESAIEFMEALMPYSAEDSTLPRLERISDRSTVVEGKTERVSTIPQYQKVSVEDDQPPADDQVEITVPDAPEEPLPESYRGEEPRPTRTDGELPAPETGKSETPKTFTLSTQAPVKPSKLPLVVSLVVLVVGAILIIALAAINAGKERDRQDAAQPVAGGPATAGSGETEKGTVDVTLAIDGSPEGASIYLDGHFFGKLPHSTEVRADGKVHTVRVAMEGYAPQDRSLKLDPDHELQKVEFVLMQETSEEEEQEPPAEEIEKLKPAKKRIKIKIPSADDIYGKPKKKVKIPKADDLYK